MSLVTAAIVTVLVVDLVSGLSSHATGNTMVEEISNIVDDSKKNMKQ
jgi:hypothetical protein